MRHLAKKRFGQNFLIDEQIISDIVSAIAPNPDDFCCEIGPGQGALTRPLLATVKQLYAIEIDRDLIARFHKKPLLGLHLMAADALAFDFTSLLDQHPSQKLRLIGNLPYNISTPLLFHLWQWRTQILDMHFMLQKEVVDRMAASVHTHEYGRLSVMMQYAFHVIPVLEVPPEAFDPPPKVTSAIVRLIPKPKAEQNAQDEAHFERLVATAFSQKRKMLRNTLKDMAEESLLFAQGILPTARAENVSVAQFVGLSNACVSCSRPNDKAI